MSGISKDLLIFDASNPDSTDNVGAYLRSADGTLLTHTNVAGKDALDVNVTNELSVDLDFSSDSVDVSGSVVGVSGDVNVTQGTSPWVVSATDLDIRDLDFATDSVDVSGSSVTVSATDLDIRDLDFATDSVDVSGSNVNVSATDLDIRDLTFATDKVDASGSAVSVTGTVNVAATDLDIRDLDSAQDSVSVVLQPADAPGFGIFAEDAAHASSDLGQFILAVRNDADSPLAADGDYHALTVNAEGRLKTDAELSSDVADDAVDKENPIKVGSRSASGPLAAISAAGDKADLISDLYRRLYVNDSANIGVAASAASVAATAVNLAASALGGRRRIRL